MLKFNGLEFLEGRKSLPTREKTSIFMIKIHFYMIQL